MPFLELRLYNQLLVKLSSLHCNAVFGISVEMEIGGSLLAGVITGTAVYIPGLPDPETVTIGSPFKNINGIMDSYKRINVGTLHSLAFIHWPSFTFIGNGWDPSHVG